MVTIEGSDFVFIVGPYPATIPRQIYYATLFLLLSVYVPHIFYRRMIEHISPRGLMDAYSMRTRASPNNLLGFEVVYIYLL